VEPVFYDSLDKLGAANLLYVGALAGNPDRPVLAGWITAPEREGIFTLSWSSNKLAPLPAHLEVTCDDGSFCNGGEYFVRGHCVSTGRNPCHFSDTDPCLQHQCFETGLCSKEPQNAQNCNQCGPICQPKCHKAQKCGSGGCPVCQPGQSPMGSGCVLDDAFCGACLGPGEICSDGQCIVPEVSNTPGSCNNPYPLFQDNFDGNLQLTNVVHLLGNPLTDGTKVPTRGVLLRVDVPYIDNMEDLTKASCQSPGVQEHVFSFTIDDTVSSGAQGIEVMMISSNVNEQGTSTDERFDNGAIDALLAIHGEDCEPLAPGAAAFSMCSDDATPPGNLASHVFARLTPGNYRLAATYFAPQASGPYMLMVKFTDGSQTCFPQCDGKFCGSDECSIFDEITQQTIPTICGLEQYLDIDECNEGLYCIQGRCSNCEGDYVDGPFYVSSCPVNGECG
jgi:hypothetical protein